MHFVLQRASFTLRVSVMKGKNLMAKDANGEGCLCSFTAIDGKQHLFSVRGYEMSSCPFANSNTPLTMNAIVYY